ncbi:MAG: hypothetical protein U9N80_08255 [Chloroflexota bacterium]|nr:hypothetical protein [Chloroflexota bacterium]
MIIPIVLGHFNKFKKRGELALTCLICGSTRTCRVEEWWRKSHFLFIPVKIVAHGYLFTWKECGHSLGMSDPKVVAQYESRRVISSHPVQPYLHELQPMGIKRPVPVTPMRLLLISPLILFTGSLVVFVFATFFVPLIIVVLAVLGLL